MTKETAVRGLISRWEAYRGATPAATRYCLLKSDLYRARNPGFNGSPPLSAWPANLVDPDDEVMASVEHYFLTRCWVGSGQFPAWQVRLMRDIYDAGKRLGVTPAHNPGRPVTPPSAMQSMFQEEGIAAGERDLAASGRTAPWIAEPPLYY